MNPEELRQRCSDCFDDPERAGAGEAMFDGETVQFWTSLARHLQSRHVIAIPADFRDRVHRSVARARIRRDFALLAKVGFGTALIVTFVTAFALEWDWWSRVLAVLDPQAAVALIDSSLRAVFATTIVLSPLVPQSTAFWLLLPLALFAAAAFAATAEFAVFRVLRRGPFATSPTRARRVTSHSL